MGAAGTTQDFEAFAVTLNGGDASEACRLDLRRERNADVANTLRPRESGACPIKLRPRGVGGCRRDEPVQRAQLPDRDY